ncbi:TRAP transporter small permease protein [Alsobacter metallidurans]|uniref:TRAP transporter small permease protein n=1 Tax=Alsobacter metallidurans TaxID=340221 RepID=A0A917I9M4_9HYPH|nr:TRAP transporter small permease [Alsobacter metallidurans]GGH22953.1 TRAP transporter small permease protein [Alsobacter metallidurans]
MPPANPISRVVEPVARVVAIVFGYTILLYSVALSVEIVGRKLFNTSFKGIDEVGGFVLAISAAVGASYTMAMRGHTRVDVFLVRMPKAAQRVLNTLAMVSMAAFAAFAGIRSIAVLQETLEFGSTSSNLQQPLWIPQAMWVVGLGLFGVIATAYAAHAVWLLATSDPRLNAFYGPLTVDDELESELASLEARQAEEVVRG